MNYQTKLRELDIEMISKLTAITDRPEEWLPHKVYVEGVCDIYGTPIYTEYKLLDYLPDGECQLLNVVTSEEETGNLSEIESSWLATLVDRYEELSGKKLSPARWYVFLYPIEADRNAPDDEIVKLWKETPEKVQRYTLDEFDDLSNNEEFYPDNYWIAHIKI